MAGVGAAAGRPQPGKQEGNPKDGYTELLPTFIYDYFLKKGNTDVARAILHSDSGVKTKPRTKTSPGGRDVNGVDEMDRDSKDSLPLPDVMEALPDDAFLQQWWRIFWDMWAAGKKPGAANGMAGQYLHHQQARQVRRQGEQFLTQQQQQMQMNMNVRALQNNLNHNMNLSNDMRRGAMQKNQMNRNMGQPPQMGQTPMQREGSDADRPQSPMSGDNAPSPKRQRIDGPGGNQQTRAPMPTPGQTPNMMQNGFADPNNAMFNGINMPGKSGPYPMAGMQGRMPMNGDFKLGTPALNGAIPPNIDANQMQELMTNGGQTGQQGGALADYQMQLMLLEQQNKRRLLMARQEQEVSNPQAAMMAQPAFSQNMSHDGSRSGNSPSPNDQVKRQTPNMAQMSPRPDGLSVTRGSPAPNMDPSQMPREMNPQFFQQMGKMPDGSAMPNGMRPGGPGFNIPGSVNPQHHEQLMQMQMGRGRGAGAPQPPPGNWVGGRPQQGQGPGQAMPPMPQQPGQSEGQQRNNTSMPPPPGPNGNTAQSSPAQPPAPATPSQNKNSNAKGKKETKETKKKNTKKGGQAVAGVTPNEPEETPPTPNTPYPPEGPLSGPRKPNQTPNSQPQPPNGPQAPANNIVVPPENVGGQGAPFGEISNTEMGGDLDPSMSFTNPMESSDVLEGFDFDSFLHMDHTTPGFPEQDIFSTDFNPGSIDLPTNDG